MAKRGRKKAKDDKGYLDSNKKNHTDYKVINGNKITMEGVSGKIYAIPIDKNGQAGKGRLMNPGENHEFEGAAHIIEVPETQMAQGGLNTGASSFVQNFGNQFMGLAKEVGNTVYDGTVGVVNDMHERTGGLDYAFLNPNSKNFVGNTNWRSIADTPSEGGEWGNSWEGGSGRIPRYPENPLPSQNPRDYPNQQSSGQGLFDRGYDYFNDPDGLYSENEKSVTPTFNTDFGSGEVDFDPSNASLTDDTSNGITQYGDVGNSSNTQKEVTSDQEEIDPTKKIQFHNPYGGVDLASASHILGKSFGYEGDQTGANTTRGVASGLKLLAGLGRNIMSGVGQEKRNQYMTDEANRKLRNSGREVTMAQSGGKITDKDVDAIGKATGLDFDLETANRLFGHTPKQTTTPSQEIDFGKYKDVGYFETGEMHNGKRVIYNTDRNPMNYDDNRRNALNYLRELNGDNFEFQYRDKTRPQTNQIVSRQKGGKVKAADLLSGAYITGDPNSIPNVEVEKGEHVKDNQSGQVQEVAGKKHSQGGEKMNLPDHSVLSDYNKIGGDLAKKYRDEFDIKIKAKDTFATAFDKVLKKTGYKSKADELTEYIEKTEKEQEKAKKSDSEATTGINMTFLSGKINDLTKELEPLEEVKSNVFETMFEDQQGKKSAKELREEGSEMAEGGETGEMNIKRPSNVSDEQWERMKTVYDIAVKNGDRYPELTVAQAILETGWFEKPIAETNIFGQKAASSQSQVAVDTTEFINGVETPVPDEPFRKYESLEEAMQDRMRLWGSRYNEAENIEEALNTILGADGKSAYATDPNYASKILNILGNRLGVDPSYGGIGDGNELPNIPEEISTPRNTKKGSVENPWTSNPDLDFIREDFDTDQPLTNVDGSEYEEGEDITETKEFREWFHNNKVTDTMTPVGRLDLDIPEIQTNATTRTISEEERRRRAETNAPEEDLNEEVVENGDGTEYQTMLLPDQTPLPPSAMQPARLGEVSPREAEATLISPEAQIEEINRQAQAARRDINSLPDSQRRAALAQLNSRTQQSINQVMSQTNRANAQIQNQTEQFNTQTQNQAEGINESMAQNYEQKILTAKDRTENDVRAFFNRLTQNQIGNKLTIDELNAANANNSSFQYNAAGEFEQTGKGFSQEEIARITEQVLAVQQEEENKKNSTKKAKRGRKTK